MILEIQKSRTVYIYNEDEDWNREVIYLPCFTGSDSKKKFVLLSAFTYICHISREVMKSSDILKEIKRIAKEVLPKGGQLILYGSRARNEATEDSDWDLLILLDKPNITVP